VGRLQPTPLTHHPVLPQDFNEVEGVEAQEQNELVLTFPVIACSLGGEAKNKRLPPRPAERESPLRAAPNSSGAEQQLRQDSVPIQCPDKNPTLSGSPAQRTRASAPQLAGKHA